MIALYVVSIIQSEIIRGDEFKMYEFTKEEVVNWMKDYRPDLSENEYCIREVRLTEEDIKMMYISDVINWKECREKFLQNGKIN